MDRAELAAAFPHLYAPAEGWVFVVSCGRSGSTVLQHLLNTIPGWCIRGENANALTHLCRLVADLEDQEMVGPQFGPPGAAAGTPADPWYGAAEIDVARTARQMFDLFCKEILHLPADLRVGGFKEIRYVEDLDFLPRQLDLIRSYFPHTRLVFLTRAAEEVARSGWWTSWPAEDVIPEIEAANAAFAAYAGAHEACFLLDHARFAEGADALAPLFAFLNEDFAPETVQQVLDQRLTHGRTPG